MTKIYQSRIMPQSLLDRYPKNRNKEVRPNRMFKNLSANSIVPVQIQKIISSENQPQEKKQQLINPTADRETLAPIADSTIIKSNQETDRLSEAPTHLDRAIGKYQKEAKLQPNSSSIQLDLGDLYAKQNKWQGAIACYNKALRIDPRDATAHLKLAKALAKTENRAEHLDHMYFAYSLKPDLGSADDHFLLGEAQKNLGNRKKAIACYEQAIKLQPHFSDAYKRLGQLFQEIGKPKNAIACYQTAVRHNPQDVDFYLNLGDLFGKQNNWEK